MVRTPTCRLLPLVLLAVAAEAATVPLEIRSPAGRPVSAWPLTTGVPFPSGALADGDAVRVVDGATEVPAQVTVTGRHLDGSVRWLLLDLQLDVPAAGRTLTLEYGPGVRRAAVPRPLQVADRPEAVTVDTGPLQLVLRKGRFNGLDAVTGGGRTLVRPGHDGGPYFVTDQGDAYRVALAPDSQVAVELVGPLRTVVTARGWYQNAAGERRCRAIVRVHAFAGQPWVRVFVTWVMTESSGALRFRDLGFGVPLAVTGARFGVGDRAVETAVTADRPAWLVQSDVDRSRLHPQPPGAGPAQQAAGWLAVNGPDGACTMAVRDFRELFPKELEAVATGPVCHFWPAHAEPAAPRPVTDAMIQSLWFAHEGQVLDFTVPASYSGFTGEHSENDYRYLRSAAQANAMGLAKTHELLLCFDRPGGDLGGRAADLNAAFQDPPTVLPAPRWMCDSGVFGRIHPCDPERFPADEAMLSATFDAERRMQAHTRDYGMWNYGDGHTSWDTARGRFSDVYRVWRNTHHGAPRLPWLLYVRSGDPKYLRFAERNTRHVADLDFCHHATPELEALPYPRGKLHGALNDYKGIVHWHSGNRLTDYNSMTDFLLWSWHLTGDRWGLEVALDWGEAVKARYQKPFGNREGAGTCDALLELYRETLDPRYRELGEALARHLISTQKPDGSFPQWENYAPWLERYCELTGDAAAKQCLVKWADAYYQGYGDSMSTYRVGGELNTLAYAWFYTGEVKYLARGRWLVDQLRASVVGDQDPLLRGLIQQGQVSLTGYGLQRLPHLLRALAEHGRPVQPDLLVTARPGFGLLFERTRPVVDGQPAKVETVEPWILETTDTAFTVTLHTTHTYDQRRYLGQVLAPDGKVVLAIDEQVPRGDKDFRLAIPADGQTGVYRVRLGGFGSYGRFAEPIVVEPALPVAFPLAGRILTEDAAGYWLYVPRGVTRLSLRVTNLKPAILVGRLTAPEGGRTQFTVPAGDQPVTVAEVRPEPDQTGQPWALHLNGSSCQVEVVAGGVAVPPLLFPQAYPPAVCEAFRKALADRP